MGRVAVLESPGPTLNTSADIDAFLAKYSADVAAQLREARAHVSKHFPQGFELVYDNYNALVFAFASSERASDAVVSVAGYPKWVTLFFLQGATLPDPTGVLEGKGSQVRSVRLSPPSRLLEPAVQALIKAAKANNPGFGSAPKLATLIRSVSTTQRDRKPTPEKTSRKVGKANQAKRSGA